MLDIPNLNLSKSFYTGISLVTIGNKRTPYTLAPICFLYVCRLKLNIFTIIRRENGIPDERTFCIEVFRQNQTGMMKYAIEDYVERRDSFPVQVQIQWLISSF